MVMSDGFYALKYYRILYNLPITKVRYLYGDHWIKTIPRGVEEDDDFDYKIGVEEDDDFDYKIVSRYEFDMKTKVLSVWLVGKEANKGRTEDDGETEIYDGDA